MPTYRNLSNNLTSRNNGKRESHKRGLHFYLNVIIIVGLTITVLNFSFNYDVRWIFPQESPQVKKNQLPPTFHDVLVVKADDSKTVANSLVAKEFQSEPQSSATVEKLSTAKSDKAQEKGYSVAVKQSQSEAPSSTITPAVKQVKCEIPKLTHNDPLAYKLDYEQAAPYGLLEDPPCVNNSASKFAVDLHGNLYRLRLDDAEFWNGSECYYQPYWRVEDKPDFVVRKGQALVVPPNKNITLMPDQDFIRVWCKKRRRTGGDELVYEDILNAVLKKPKLEAKLDKRSGNDERYSILIFGMDSTSHMKFRRHMPRSHDYLVNVLNATEFHGFNSLGAGTLWSVMAFLSGRNLDELRSSCVKSQHDFYDDCPWIWKDLEKLGYRTAYAEDEMRGTPIFNERPYPGFKRQPWHYDFRPAALQLGPIYVGHNIGYGAGTFCLGSRMSADRLLENLRKFAFTFRDKPYFHFTYTVALSHYINWHNRHGDPHLLSTMQFLYDNKLLENTVLIILSDHGPRYGPLRQRTRQGFLEERLPVLYVALPAKLRTKYPEATKNFQTNANRLISAFDLYATMQDLAHPAEELTDARILERASDPALPRRREVSLFLPVSETRDCKTIGLTHHFTYCICQKRKPVPVDVREVGRAAQRVVETINSKISNYSQCAKLNLINVTEAYELQVDFNVADEKARFRVRSDGEAEKLLGAELEVGVTTEPGGGQFYAGVTKQRVDWDFQVRDITRISAYGHDADCIDVKELKQFCYCAK